MRAAAVITALALAPFAGAQVTKVLFIGNSYTGVNDLPNTVRQLALSLGDTIVVGSSTPGGYTFQLHTTYAPTLTAISAQAWDFVVLQEQSQIPSFPLAQVEAECLPYAAQLVNLILANDSCSQAVFYMTWGRRDGDAQNCASWPPVCTYEGMQSLLRERYLLMGTDNDAFVAPVGAAWRRVREEYPMLDLYMTDGSHPSPAGTYLAASVFYSTLFRSSSIAATYASTLDPDTAAILRGIASGTVLDSLATWNIGVNDPDAAFTSELVINGTVQFSSEAVGDHWWSFGDGTTSVEEDPLHTLVPGEPGSIVSHTVTDACGRTDTVTAWVPFYVEGVPMSGVDPIHAPRASAGAVTFRDLRSDDVLLLHDATGRVLERSVARGTSLTLAVPSGLVLWRVLRDGRSTSGHLVVP